MKKLYLKPEIAFQSMTLNTATATCETYYVTDCKYYEDPNHDSSGFPFAIKDELFEGTIFINGDDLSSGCNETFYCYQGLQTPNFLQNRS